MAPSPTLAASRILGALVADIVPASVRRRVHPAIAEIRQRIVDMSDEEDSAMEDDTDPGANDTIDLVTSDEDEADDDADDDDEEEQEDYNSDLIVVSYNTDV